ncbi:MAG TPA: MAPEG family protein [Trichocoleus sp.]
MSIAFWCILAVLLAPYILSVLARSQVSRPDYVGDPRAYSEGLTGWHRRAHLAHLNAFEATPAIIAGVMVAEFAQAPRGYIDALAVAFVGFRALHAVCYLADKPMWRSHAWRMGILCVIALFVAATLYGSSPE